MSMKKMTFFDKNAKKVAGDKKKADNPKGKERLVSY